VGSGRTAAALGKVAGVDVEPLVAQSAAEARNLLKSHSPIDIVLFESERVQSESMEIIAETQRLNANVTILIPPPGGDPHLDLVVMALQHRGVFDRSTAPVPIPDSKVGVVEEHGLAPTHARHNVLVIDDDRMTLRLVQHILENNGYNVITADNGVKAQEILGEVGAQYVITDWMIPKLTGFDLCRWIRGNEHLGLVYIMIITAFSDRRHLIEAFDAGADDFLQKPFDPEELIGRMRAASRIIQLESDIQRRNREIQKQAAEMAMLNEKLHELATTDELTGLLNRRHGMTRLRNQWSSAARYQLPLSVILFDIDHFKKFNDVHGHAAGDAVLHATAAGAAKAVRAADFAARVGGEEFLIVCPNTPADGALILAERLREDIEKRIVNTDGKHLSATVSLGIAERDNTMTVAEDLVKAADHALYAAKNSGRNRVCVAPSIFADHATVETV
jgi:diguanylate cyclase (GGDEF)-like protein